MSEDRLVETDRGWWCFAVLTGVHRYEHGWDGLLEPAPAPAPAPVGRTDVPGPVQPSVQCPAEPSLAPGPSPFLSIVLCLD